MCQKAKHNKFMTIGLVKTTCQAQILLSTGNNDQYFVVGLLVLVYRPLVAKLPELKEKVRLVIRDPPEYVGQGCLWQEKKVQEIIENW
jgi:hypothetical protein